MAEYDLTTGSLNKEYVYGAKGLVATIEPSNGTSYATSDHLGSPRVITNSSAGVVSRHDYMPFGEELCSGVGGRTSGMGFCANDGVRQKFTSHERDIEIGLDYFINRFLSSGQGRFTSSDSLTASAKPTNPQTWNRYVYVLNNPVRLIDPHGLDAEDPQEAARVSQDEPNPINTQKATLPDGSCKGCSGQIVTTVVIEQMNEPGARVRDVKGKESLVVGVDLRVTFLDQNGKAIKGTVSESLDPTVIQTKDAVSLDSKGRGSDLVSNSFGSVPKSEGEQKQALDKFNENYTNKQIVTFTVTPENGPKATVTQERTLTNQVPGAPRIAQGYIKGYTFSMEKPRIKIP